MTDLQDGLAALHNILAEAAGRDCRTLLTGVLSADEIADLRALADAAERIQDSLHQIRQWSVAYPLDVFPEPDKAYYAKAADVLAKNGMTLDRLSAAAMRHVLNGIIKIVDDALPPPPATEGER